jgi:hypothetical protein
MNAKQNKSWNKGAKIGSRAVGTSVGALLGGPAGAATGNAIGAGLDPLVEHLFPVFNDNYLVKENISSGTMADNYQYGKTDDSYSMTNKTIDPLEDFTKGTGYWDTGMQLVGVAGGVANNNYKKGVEVAGKALLMGGTGGAVAGLGGMEAATGSGLLAETPIDANSKTLNLLDGVTDETERGNIVQENKKDYSKGNFFQNISDALGNRQQKRADRNQNLSDDVLFRDMDEEAEWESNPNKTHSFWNEDNTRYNPLGGQKRNRFNFFNRRNKNIPSY